jgi:hypothetical protein
MHCQPHHRCVMIANRAHLWVAKTPPQPFFDANKGKEVLKGDKGRVRGQILRLKSNARCLASYTFPKVHPGGLRFDCCLVFRNSNCPSPEITFCLRYTIFSTAPPCETRNYRGHFPSWLNLTRSDVKPEAVAYREFPISRAEEASGPNTLCSLAGYVGGSDWADQISGFRQRDWLPLAGEFKRERWPPGIEFRGPSLESSC